MVSVAFTSAPRASSDCTTSTLPANEAVISTVSPEGSSAVGFAPAFSRVSTIFALVVLPFRQATASGVTP